MGHIAILKQPYFDLILNDKKTIESRWSMHKIAPYKKLKIGDEIFLKETGKYITAKALVKEVKYFELTPTLVKEIVNKYGVEIGISDKEKFILEQMNKKYCTLIWLSDVKTISPIKPPRSNGAGWISLNQV